MKAEEIKRISPESLSKELRVFFDSCRNFIGGYLELHPGENLSPSMIDEISMGITVGVFAPMKG